MAVYREYDQAGLDAQYNNRAAVADAPQFIARWEADSEAVRQAGGPPAELAYGDHPRHTLDVFAGPGVTAPTLVFIHGGYWHMLEKTAYHFPAPAITGAGINYVALEYPLAPEVTIGDIVASVRRAGYFRSAMSETGFDIKPGIHPIVPVMLYQAPLSQEFAARLLREGVYVIGFFYPVVPQDEARIRVQISAAHEQSHLDRAVEAFTKVGKELGVL